MPRIILSVGLILPLLAAGIMVPSAAQAQQAPDDRCSGTLCDFYYGSSKPTPAAPAATGSAPTPMTVPTTGYLGSLLSGSPSTPGAASPAAPSRLQVQGGGLVGMATGAPAERCSGTLCDLYYGGPPPERPEQPTEQQAAQTGADAAEPVAEEARPSPRRHAIAPPAEPQRCASPANDPWRCYR